MAGWIKLHRKLQQSPMYKALNCKQRDVFIQCLLLANHSPNQWEWGASICHVEPGQFITSLDSLASVCSKDVSVQSVRTALLKLEKWGFLTNISTKTGRLITIVKWDSYQIEPDESNKDPNRQLTNEQQTANKDLTTNKNVKNVKNKKNVENKTFCPVSSSEAPDSINPKIWDMLVECYGNRLKKVSLATAAKLGENLSDPVYSGVDVPAQIKKAAIWEDSNPGKKKTPRGIPRFLTAWMDRAQNRGTGAAQPASNNRATQATERNETPAEAKQRRAMEAIKNFGVDYENNRSNRVHNGDVPIRVPGKVQYIK